MRFIAYYVTPKSSNDSDGEFEFESPARMKSKKNLKDARLALIKKLGAPAVSYVITDIKKLS